MGITPKEKKLLIQCVNDYVSGRFKAAFCGKVY